MVNAIERKRRNHFLFTRAKALVVQQQRQFVSLLCREIKNPLNVISYFLNSISLSAAANDSPPINGTTENSVFSAQFLPDAIRCAQLLVCLL